VPAAVTPGTTLEYVVTLGNLGEEPMNLNPCPGYRQELRADDPGQTRLLSDTRRLNCDAQGVIPPGGGQRFVMHVDVPASLRGSELSLQWELVDAWDTGGQAWIRVDPATHHPRTG